MTTDRSAMLPFLEKLEMRTIFSQEEREAILDLPFHPAQVRPNHDFVRQGELVHHSCFVLDGVVGAFKQDSEGERQIVAIGIHGDMIDLHTVAMPEALSALQALTSTTILQVPHDALRRIARAHPNIAQAFWRDCVIDSGILMEWVVNVGRRDARQRMAHFYCELACRSAREEPRNGMAVRHPITQFQLGDILGLTAVHVNRTLKGLRQSRLLETIERSSVRILDWAGLSAAGDFDSNYLQLGLRAEAA